MAMLSSEDATHAGGRPPMRAHAAARPLFGAERVAALLLALDKPIAGRLLKRLDSLELRQVTRAASELGSVNPATVERLISEKRVRRIGERTMSDAARWPATASIGTRPWKWTRSGTRRSAARAASRSCSSPRP